MQVTSVPPTRKERIDRPIKALTDEIYAICSWREMTYLLLPRFLPVALLLTLPLMKDLVGEYWVRVLTITCAMALLALSWDFLAQVGLFSLGHAFMFAAGAYASGMLQQTFNFGLIESIAAGSILGAITCTLLILPTLRLRGVYFSVLTLILPLLAARLIESTKILGGSEGISGLKTISDIWTESYVIIVTLLVTLFGLRRLMGEDYGIVLQAVKDSDQTVISCGISVTWMKAQSVFLSSLIACFVGAYLTHVYGATGLSAFGLDYSLMPLAAAVLGGVGTLVGPVIGSFVLVPLSEVLRSLGTLRVVFYSLILMVCVIGLPEGIFPYLSRKYHQLEREVTV